VWDSRDKNYHYNQKQLPKENSSLQEINAVTTPQINPEKVYLPPLNIPTGLLKNLFKAMYQNIAGFMYLNNMFPRIKKRK